MCDEKLNEVNNRAVLDTIIAEIRHKKRSMFSYFIWFLMQIFYLLVIIFFYKKELYVYIIFFMVALISIFVIVTRIKEKRFKKIILQLYEENKKLKEERVEDLRDNVA